MGSGHGGSSKHTDSAACLRIRDGLGLLLVVGLAPARDLLVGLLVLLGLLLKLGQHVLDEVDHLLRCTSQCFHY